MLEHFKGDEAFVKKILDFQNQAEDHQRMILTPFYNPHQQDVVYKVIGQSLQVKAFGGFENAENKRMIICPDFYVLENADFDLKVVEVCYNAQFGTLRHQDVLGALMNLGIKRECIGDIYNQDGRLFFACNASTYTYIQMNLNKIKKSKVHFKEIDETITIHHQFRQKTFFLSSLRLDKIVSTLFNVSRQNASEAIRAGHVKVNHKIVEEVSFLCHNNDIVSFSKHGRVQIVDENRQTKQGNYVVTGFFYR